MAMSWGTFDKEQDDDLVRALARQESTNRQGLSIAQAFDRQRSDAVDQDIKRDTLEGNAEYRRELAAARNSRVASETEERDSRIAARTAAAEDKKRVLARAQATLADPNASPDEKRIANAVLMDLKPSISVTEDKPTKKPLVFVGRSGSVRNLGEVDANAQVINEPAPQSAPTGSWTTKAFEDGIYAWDNHTGQRGAKLSDHVPTSQSRNSAESRARAETLIDQVDEMTARINQYEGIMASAAGAVAKQKAKLNLDSDAAEYQAFVDAYTPLIARAIGHTGVLTDPDVVRSGSALPLLTDSREVRNRKMVRLRGVFAAMNGASNVKTPATTPPAPGAKPKFELLP